MPSSFTLEHHTHQPTADPLVLVILDGVGLYRGRREGYPGNALDQASTPTLDRLFREAPIFLQLKAHGTAVGLPSDDDMGNSEVGHNAIGAGRVFDQGAKLVNRAVAEGTMFESDAWRELVGRVKQTGGTFHLLGLVSDGNVHSNIDHLYQILGRLDQEGVERVRIHALADGRDVEPVSFHRYLERLEGRLGRINDGESRDYAVASGGGRMHITMDRYEADWSMVKRGWETHVLGNARGFHSAAEAVETLRREHAGIIDQDLPAFVVVDSNGTPIGPVVDGDVFVLFNFRGDRAIEFSRAMTEPEFDAFDRGPLPDVRFAGMMEYDGDLHIPPQFLVEPPAISRTVSEYLVHNGISQLAVAETQKFGHVTYFWNGNNSSPFDRGLETWVEVPSDTISFDRKPEMKAKEVCDVVVKAVEDGGTRMIRVNFANGDMVGHTGSLEAAITAAEVVDACVRRLEATIEAHGGMMIVTADHGNLDMMYEVDAKTQKTKVDESGKPIAKTSHTLSPVPFALIGAGAETYRRNESVTEPGLANITATLMVLLGFEPPEGYLPALVLPAEETDRPSS